MKQRGGFYDIQDEYLAVDYLNLDVVENVELTDVYLHENLKDSRHTEIGLKETRIPED